MTNIQLKQASTYEQQRHVIIASFACSAKFLCIWYCVCLNPCRCETVILIYCVWGGGKNIKHISEPDLFVSHLRFVSPVSSDLNRTNFFSFCFYMNKFNKISFRAGKREHLIHEPQTWKLSCIWNAASISLKFVLLQKPKWLKTVEYVHKSIAKWSTCQRQSSTVSSFNCFTTLGSLLLLVMPRIKRKE